MIVVIGAGIVGLSIAHHLSTQSRDKILLFEKEFQPGMGITQFCSGGIRCQFTSRVHINFSLRSLQLFDKLNETINFRKYGYLILDTETDAKKRVQSQRQLGVKTELIANDEALKKYPFLNLDRVKGITLYKEEGTADVSLLIDYYHKTAKDNGVEFVFGERIEEVLLNDNGAEGVLLKNGEKIFADKVVLACGIEINKFIEKLGIHVPLATKRKYVFLVDSFEFSYPVVLEHPKNWYIKKEGNDALVGMSGKLESIDYEKKEESMQETLEHTVFRVPSLENSSIKKMISSLSDETEDKHGVIDMPIPGFILASGFSGHGFMHSPAIGQAVTDLVMGKEPVLDISDLKLNRSVPRESFVI